MSRSRGMISVDQIWSASMSHHGRQMSGFSGLLIDWDSTLRDSMAAIEANGREVVLVQDGDNRVVGLVTDGDIRRGLLVNIDIHAPVTEVMTRDFFSVS